MPKMRPLKLKIIIGALVLFINSNYVHAYSACFSARGGMLAATHQAVDPLADAQAQLHASFDPFGPGPLRPSTLACKKKVLSDLGWKIKINPLLQNPKFQNPNGICHSDDTDKASVEKNLTVEIPAENMVNLNQLLQSSQNLCAFKTKLQLAGDTAATKLRNNLNYNFPPEDWQAYITLQNSSSWKELQTGFGPGTAFIATVSNSKAIEALYTEKYETECKIGQLIQQYATLYELYGKADFDKAFKSEELILYFAPELAKTKSAVQGQRAGKLLYDPTGQSFAKQGNKFLVGVSGAVRSLINDKKLLDSPDDVNENFVITSVPETSAKELAKTGGFSRFDTDGPKIVELATGLTKEQRQKYMETSSEDDLEALKSSANAQAITEIETLLSNPIYDIEVYTHPMGKITLREHIKRLISLNPRMPYGFALYQDNANGGLFERYLNSKLLLCEKQNSL